jgi:hypothetical protein
LRSLRVSIIIEVIRSRQLITFLSTEQKIKKSHNRPPVGFGCGDQVRLPKHGWRARSCIGKKRFIALAAALSRAAPTQADLFRNRCSSVL